jgi:hypothetical protein
VLIVVSWFSDSLMIAEEFHVRHAQCSISCSREVEKLTELQIYHNFTKAGCIRQQTHYNIRSAPFSNYMNCIFSLYKLQKS